MDCEGAEYEILYGTPSPLLRRISQIRMEYHNLALFFSSLLVHQSGTNMSSSIRWSCHFRYNNLLEPTFIARGYPHPYLYRPQEELITPNFPSLAEVEAVFGLAAPNESVAGS